MSEVGNLYDSGWLFSGTIEIFNSFLESTTKSSIITGIICRKAEKSRFEIISTKNIKDDSAEVFTGMLALDMLKTKKNVL